VASRLASHHQKSPALQGQVPEMPANTVPQDGVILQVFMVVFLAGLWWFLWFGVFTLVFVWVFFSSFSFKSLGFRRVISYFKPS